MQRELTEILEEHGTSLGEHTVYLMRHADKRHPEPGN